MRIINYNRTKAVDYALKWAYGRNPAYADFENMGGDCTNFASQCIYAGAGVMNFTPTFGWYYRSLNDRSPAWSSARYLNKFLLSNSSVGPFARVVSISEIKIGDIIQLADSGGDIYHSLFVTKIVGNPNVFSVYVTAHTFDSLNRSLASYSFNTYMPLQIMGVRTW